MIKSVNIQNFKSIKNISIGFSNLNMLFGNNSVGKSSIIQSMLLLRQSYYYKNNLSELRLNGELVDFGNFNDILCDTSEEDDAISIFVQEKENISLECQYKKDINDNIICHKSDIRNINDMSLFNDDFVYLNAQHISPQFSYDIKNWNNASINKYGNNGQFVFPYISKNFNMTINTIFKNNSEISDDLSSVLNYWLNNISENIELNCEINNNIGEAIAKFYYRDYKGVRSLARNPMNVGYGITHVLSLIYALITSSKKSLIFIENPESHLHPKAQTAIGTLIAYSAMVGAQIVCETHSEHIINAIRVAIKENKINSNIVNVLYFTKNDNFESEYRTIEIDKNGSFDEYPIGFLDEWDNALVKLV